jgi:predicted type IV restriction endonuclease
MVPNIRASLRKFASTFIEAREASCNESETVYRVRQFFEKVLGYDPDDVSSETEMKSKYVDLCLKIDGRIRVLVEAKGACVKLRDRHIEQAWSYASRNNFRWVLLTNGIDWNLYHLTFEEGIEYEKAFAVALDTPNGVDEAAKNLAYLHKRSVRKGDLERFWEMMSAMCAPTVAKAIFNESVLRVLRRQIRRDAGVLIDTEDLAKAIHEMLSQEAREELGRVRIRKKRRSPRKPTASAPLPVVGEGKAHPPVMSKSKKTHS